MVDMCKELNFDENSLTLFVFITNKCNYSCVYCCEKLLLGNTFLDLKKMYDFILFICHKYDFKKYYLDIYGGETTLHPDLYDFCKKIYELDKNFNIAIYTNFSADSSTYIKLLNLSKNMRLLITYHHSQVKFSFEEKAKQLNEYKSQINYSLMYEQNNIKHIIDIYNKNKEKNIQNMCMSLIYSLCFYKSLYTEEELALFNETNSTSSSMVKFLQCSDFKNNKTFLINQERTPYTFNFFHWSCSAGKNSLIIDYKGNIIPCYEIHSIIFKTKNIDSKLKKQYISKYVSSIYSDYNDFQLKPTLCPLKNCSACDMVCIKNIFKFERSIYNVDSLNKYNSSAE